MRFLGNFLSALFLCVGLPWTIVAEPAHPTQIALIDVDRNGTPDFEYRGGTLINSPGCSPFDPGYPEFGYGLFGLNGNQVLRSGAGCTPFMAGLETGTIPPTTPVDPANWGPMGELLTHYFHGLLGPSYMGYFHGATNGYAAVRFSSPAGIHYGWIQFTNGAPDQPPVIAGFAAEPRVNTPLEVGSTAEETGTTNSTLIRIPGATTVLGTVASLVTSNGAPGAITRKILLEVAPDLKCLVRNDPKHGPTPVSLEDRRPLSAAAPPDAFWLVPQGPLLLLEQIEMSNAAVSSSGPLAGTPAILIALGNSSGDHWWIEVSSTGKPDFIGHSHINQGPLVVGQPSMHSQWTNAAIDLDGDNRMDFAYQAIAPGTAQEEHSLHPFRHNRILVPLFTPRTGSMVGTVPAVGSAWTNSQVTLWKASGAPDRIAAGTNGFVAVELTSTTGTRYGWIQFNYYEFIHGVIGWQTITSSHFDFIDYGVSLIPERPLEIGAGSAAPKLTLHSDRVELSWHPLRSRAVLEWAEGPNPDGWTPLTFGDRSAFSMPLLGMTNQAYFRLRPSAAKPAFIW